MNDSSETDTLKKDLEQLRKDFASLSKDVKHGSRDRIGIGMEKARKGCDFVSKEIESRPYVCMMTAFGLGLLLGKAIKL